jgi:hypothetical protein
VDRLMFRFGLRVRFGPDTFDKAETTAADGAAIRQG